MAKTLEGQLVPLERIESRIFVLRGHRVMLDRDLAGLYGAATRVLASRSQTVTLKRGQNIKYAPHVFTEHGAVMLANVLRSRVAIRASIQVVRAFVHLRQMLASHDDLARRIDAIERRAGKHDVELQEVLRILRKHLEPPPVPAKRPLGFMPARPAGK